MTTLLTGHCARKNSGYALIAAMLVMFLLTALGLVALVTSTSEMRIIKNLGEDEIMFGFGEQGIDRLLSHLHYMPQGLFGPLKREGMGRSLSNLSAFQLWSYDDKIKDLYLGANWASGSYPSQHPLFRIQAYMDIENLRTPSGGHSDPYDTLDPKAYLDQSFSRDIAISVSVRNDKTGYEKAFRAYVKPKTIWDMAYFSDNHTPLIREAVTGCTVSDTAPQTWYDCQTVFHNNEVVIGDAYFRNQFNTSIENYGSGVDDGRLFVRGGPQLTGKIQWRHMLGFGDQLQTAGGSAANAPMPTSTKGMEPRGKDISLFPPHYLYSDDVLWFYNAAEIKLADRGDNCGTSNTSKCIWKIIFRNDYDWDSDGVYEESYMSSRISNKVNNGVSADPLDSLSSPTDGDPGAFVLYSLPFTTGEEKRYAYYGDVGRVRHDKMTDKAGGEIYTPTSSWATSVSGGCYAYRWNQESNATLKPYENFDIAEGQGYYVFVTPSIGLKLSAFGTAGTCPGSSTGIIFVDGDVMVSGVHDGKTTIVATGDIILDHEVQYEEHPSTIHTTYDAPRTSPNDMDMLGLFALGNIVIPNSYPTPGSRPSDCPGDIDLQRCVFYDDWSDPTGGGSGYFTGRGNIDEVFTNDTGDEEIHAVMISYGLECTGNTSDGSISCPAIDPVNDNGDKARIQNFTIGIHAPPRTADGAPRGSYYGSGWNATGNDSGRLTVYGAMIQHVSGRVGYDHSSSTCTAGTGSGCRHMGHTLTLNYDSHLKYTLPPLPNYTSSVRGVPYGLAAWDIQTWKRINVEEIANEVF